MTRRPEPVIFDSQPTLRGGRVELRPLRADDFEELYAVASDPLIWEQHPVRNRHEPPIFRAFFEESLASGGALIIIDSQSRKIIGSSRFHAYDEAHSEVEIGWTFLDRQYWGGRYNAELKRLMLQHAFQFVDAVIFLVGVDNVRSQRAVEKIGAVQVALSADAGGRESYLYRITSAKFRVQSAKCKEAAR